MAGKKGRPIKYTQKTADMMCALICEGKSIKAICKSDNMPSARTFYGWLRKHELFLQNYIRAKQDQADAFVEEILDIADDDKEDTHRSRLRVDTRKWIASKMKPKKYGDSTQIKLADADGNKLSVADVLQSVSGKTSGIPSDDG